MYYPEDFIQRVLDAFPHDKDILKQYLNSGHLYVGEYLFVHRPTPISLEDILAASSLKTLKSVALKKKEQQDLGLEWDRLYREQYSSK